MNKNWKEDWGGNLGFWDNKYSSKPGKLIETIVPLFNRAVIFKGNLWHAADDYFGWDLETSRLTQTFFFDGDGDSEF